MSVLEEIGLTRGEVIVYRTLLKLGETTTGKIVDEAAISSGKIYEILEKLIRKGLVSFIVKEKTKYFRAASPERILDYVHEKEKELKKKENEIREELPVLLSMQQLVHKEHETTLFKGIKGIETAIFEALRALKKGQEVLAMGVTSDKDERYNLLWERWHQERLKRQIVCKVLFSDRGSEYYRRLNKIKFAQVRVLEGITPSAIDILGDRVLIFTWDQQSSCLVICDERIARSFTTLFESLWKIAK